MKRNLKIIAIAAIAIIIGSSCVTKQKYLELEEQYKKCSSDLTFTTSEKIDFENRSKDLSQEVKQLTSIVEQLKSDTLSLHRKLRQSERDFAKSQRDYDALLKDFAELNMTNKTEVTKLLVDLDNMKQKLEEREAELDRQYAELDVVNINLMDKEARLAELQAILDHKDAEVKALKEKVSNALVGFEGSGLNVYERNGKVYVSMEERLLFASGSWDIGKEGEKAIKELVAILEQEQDINILIEGHTDNVPYRSSGQVKDNWDLSVLRATSVVRTLLKSGDISPARISASGRGEFVPMEDNDTPQARAKNRRTEIILTPKLDELFKIIESH